MATTLISSKKSSVGSPYAYYTFTAEVTGRTSTAVTIKFTAKGRLATSSSHFGSGLGLKAGVYIGGAWRTWTLKSTSSTWSGTSWHSASESFSITTSASTTSLTGIKVRVLRSDSNGSSCKLSATTATTSTLNIASSAVFTIAYNANGGADAPASGTKAYGVTYTISDVIPTRADDLDESGNIIASYEFLGWSGSNGTTYQPNDTYSTDANLTLTAIWGEGGKYIVSYDTVYSGATKLINQTKLEDEDITLYSTIPECNGYTFLNWLGSDGNTYSPSDTYSANANLTLTAQYSTWTHTVVFDTNGGNDDVPESFSKETGVDVNISETEPTRAGYIFSEWNTKSDGTGTRYQSQSIYSATQNGGTVTLYAIWILTDILVYTSSYCKALHFKEGADSLAFVNDGTVEAVEFIEDRTLSADGAAFYLTEILEQHNLYKLLDGSGDILIDESGNRLYCIQ